MVGRPQRFTRLTILSALLALLTPAVVSAQDDHSDGSSGATALQAGSSPTSGAIEVGGDRDVFRFAAQAGDRCTLEVTRLGSGMDSLIDLFDPRGQHMQRDDDGGEGYASKIIFTASETATYWLIVTHYDRQSGTGTYAIQLDVAGGAPATPPATAPAATPAATAGPSGLTLTSSVLDPKLASVDWESTTRVEGNGSYSATIRVYRGSSRVATIVSGRTRRAGRSYTDSWDGSGSTGDPVPPGTYTVRFEANNARQEQTLRVVRVGIRSVAFTGADRVELAYHRATAFGSPFAVDAAGDAWTLSQSALSAGCLDARNGDPLAGPSPWTNVDAPPRTSSGSIRQRGRSLPVAYVHGTTPRVRVRIGQSGSSGGAEVACGYPMSGSPLRVVATVGGSATDASGEIQPGGQATLDLAQLSRGVDRRSLTIRFRFQARVNGSWTTLPGYQETRHTLYTVLGQPTSTMLPGGTPWIAALDRVARWSDGRATTRASVLSAAVRGVNTSGLRYDVDSGAPAYTSANELHNPTLDLGAFLDGQANGRIVNCLDCASLVSKLAAQAGAESNVVVIGWGFRLNWLREIGWPQFTNSLFNGNHAFSYHAWASGDRASTVHDACLSVDDDNRPWSAPFVEGLPQGMDFDRYMDQLTPDTVPVQNLGRATVR